MIISQNPKTQSFKGIYGLRGEVGELNSALRLVKNSGVRFNTHEVETQGSQKLLAIFTEHNRKVSPKYLNLKEYFASMHGLITDARRLLTPSDIREFDFRSGEKKVSVQLEQRGLQFNAVVPENHLSSKGETQRFNINGIKFQGPISLQSAIETLSSLGDRLCIQNHIGVWNSDYITKFLGQKNAIGEAQDFAQGKVTALKGFGIHSGAFETQNNQVLKISYIPNTPQKPMSFDLPVFDRAKIPLDKKTPTRNDLFATLQQNAKNETETWIQEQDSEKVRKAIEKTRGLNVYDFRKEQVAKIGETAYLVDPECAEGRALWSGD